MQRDKAKQRLYPHLNTLSNNLSEKDLMFGGGGGASVAKLCSLALCKPMD